MDSNADIRNLRVAHWSPRSHLPDDTGPGLFLDTCLRQVYIDLSPALRTNTPLGGHYKLPEVRSGTDAYQLLLEITTGLRSAIPGETNVFGQFKDAWLAFRGRGQPAEVARLAPLMHRLINDTKAIRSEHLHGIGGASYGSLVRRLLAPRPAERILFVGAGNLARSMLPLFRHFDVGLWNRSILNDSPDSVSHLFRPEQGLQAARWANHVIFTTPPDPFNDRRWHRWIAASKGDTAVTTVVHLGYRVSPEQTTSLSPLSGDPRIKTFCLDDLLALRQRQDERRSTQLSRARTACRNRAVRLAPDDHRMRFGCLKTA